MDPLGTLDIISLTLLLIVFTRGSQFLNYDIELQNRVTQNDFHLVTFE